jgi:hypothetical protein
VIWNILNASQVAEIRERRLRIRYAAVSAVLTADYLPLRESLLTRLVDEYSVVLTEKGRMEKLIGSFETFVAPSDKGQKAPKFVTLVWTGKEVPMDASTIASVKRQIEEANEGGRQPEIEVLHHGSSEDMDTFIAASKEWPTLDTSFMQATIPTAGLRNQPAPPPSCRITTDDVLVDALVKELRLRIPALNRAAGSNYDPPRIVVITESDTSYSQAIYKELREKFQDKRNGPVDLEFFSYLRGLDGRSENTATTTEPSKQDSYDAADLILQGWGIVEKSSGTSQFDYLRRLALHLRATTKKWNGREVAAVGVLGSDIYDKIMVLQAVRRALPSAIFFTTDLDAVYLEQDYQSVTRNLVVVSADSLDINSPNVTKKLPPMRDSYQTVLAKKVRDLLPHPTPTPGLPVFEIALGGILDASTGGGTFVLRFLLHQSSSGLISTPAPAQVFEIALGRNIAMDATSGTESCILRFLSYPWANGPIFALALLNAFLVLGAVFTREVISDRKGDVTIAPMSHRARGFVLLELGGAVIGILVLAILCLSGKAETQWLGEPLALGVSIWPSVMIRLLAFLVAILLLELASRSLEVASDGQRKKLKIALAPDTQSLRTQGLAKKGAHLYRSVRRWWYRLVANVFFENSRVVNRDRGRVREPRPFRKQMFDVYLRQFLGSTEPPVWWRNSRLWRLIKYSAIYFAISACLFAIWPPSVPGRGAGALLIEKIVLALGVTLYIVHLIFCLDLHLNAFRFIRAFRSSYASPSWLIPAAKPEINEKSLLEATSALTAIIGKTLLYPLTVLILIILSRLRNFDNWVMTPSLTLTFLAGAVLLVAASLVLWLEGSRMKKDILAKHRATYEDSARTAAAALVAKEELPTENSPGLAKEKREAAQKVFEKEKADFEGINEGVFAAWYNQPIFAALLSAAAVFGSLSVAGPIARLFLN